MLGNGFIVTALLWGSALVAIIERRLRVAAAVLAIAAVATLFGLIHSPLPERRRVLAVGGGERRRRTRWPPPTGSPRALLLAARVAGSA